MTEAKFDQAIPMDALWRAFGDFGALMMRSDVDALLGPGCAGFVS
jgi:hypothetical protein